MPALISVAMWAALAVADPEPALSSEPPPEPGEIIVTGERIQRTVRDTSSSVAVADQAEIEASGANRVDQMLALIPNVQLGNGSQGPAIRGMDTTGPLYALPAFLGGNRPRMALIVDGRPVTYNEFVFGTFGVWDVDRIEVFRSPQTTTQGQNSIAGAIFVNTNDPSSNPQQRARGIFGNFRTRQISALVSGPIGADAGFRISGDFRYSRTTSRIADEIRDGDPNHDVYGLLRAKILAKPGDDTQIKLIYVHTESQSPQVVGVDRPFRKRRDNSLAYGVFRLNVDSATAALRHEFDDDLSLNVVLTGGDSHARRLAIENFGETRNDGRDWSAEALLNWSPDGPLHLLAGASHSRVKLKQFINLSLLSGSIGRFRDRQRSSGLFADATLALSQRATLNAGIRYQHDRQERLGALAADTFNVPVDFIGNFHAWLPKLTLSFDVTTELRVGAMIQKAYNPGGTTIRVDTARPDEFRAETLWDYELFARSRFAGGRGTANFNLFVYDMRDAQRAKDIFIFTPSGRRVGFANLFNVPKARSYGAEVELGWRFNDSFSAKAAIGLLDTRIVRADSESEHLEGKEFDRSPHFTGTAAVDWRLTNHFRLAVQLRHHSPYFSDRENTSPLRVRSGTNLDVRAEYRLKRLTFFAQVRNVLDALNMVELSAPMDPVTGAPLAGEAEDPRMVAIGLESRF